jgi:hypothetical protein
MPEISATELVFGDRSLVRTKQDSKGRRYAQITPLLLTH